MNTILTSDLHEGHKNIGKFRKIPEEFLTAAEGDSTVANSLWLSHYWNIHIRKRDQVYCLGDNAFNEWGLEQIKARPGVKYMMGGNHDDLHAKRYLEVFSNIRGCEKKFGVWLVHIPIHPDELRDKFCVHGHTHYHEIDDWRYINICCDNLQRHIGKPFITLDELRELIELRRSTKKVVWK
jgi:calcineurin-like phosphoesterase family protein